MPAEPPAHDAPPAPAFPSGAPVVSGRKVLLGMLAVGLTLTLIAGVFVASAVGKNRGAAAPAPSASGAVGFSAGW